jgi:competence protein ComEC
MATALQSPRPARDNRVATAPLNAEPVPAASPRYHPLVIALTAAAAGIVVDRYRPLPLPAWCAVAAAALAVWSAVDRRRKEIVASVGLLIAVAALAAAWHHDCWNLFGADEVGLFARSRQEPICVEAVAVETPRAAPQTDSNPLRLSRLDEEVRFTVEVRAIRDGDQWRAASGRAAIAVEGPAPHLAAGDCFRAFAHLLPPDHALNPGETDRADLDRGRRITAHLRVTYPEAISVVSVGHGFDPKAWLESLRLRGRQVFAHYLQPRQADLAAAVLLGLREQLDPNEIEAFQLTGTIHLLVIAGLHLSIIAGLVGFIFSRLLPRRLALPATAIFAIVYMLLVDAHPPIVRATVLIVAASWAIYIGRYRTSFNVLALAGLIVLTLNPTDLFNTGPQLSFLCVAGLMAFGPWWFAAKQEVNATAAGTPRPLPRWRMVLLRWLPNWILPEPQPRAIAKLLEQERPWTMRGLWYAARVLRHLTLVSGAIWLLTMPLVMARFHIFNPVSVVLNTVVWLPMALALGSGLALLLCSIIPGPLAVMCAVVCNWNLGIVERLVRFGAAIPYGHAWVPGPAEWWLIGFYAALGVFAAFPRLRPPLRWRGALLGAWTAAGFIVPWWTADHHGLRCTFLSVGHGEAVVLELPDGRTVLYDAGRLAAPTACCRSVSGYLWSRGLRHIDAVVLSHADTDHYNALPDLLERFSVGAVYVSPVMFDVPNEAIRYLSKSIERAKVPIRVIASGDRLSGGPGCWLEILHPPPHGLPSTSNANSIVISVEYAGRRVLLPADLQSPGLDDVLAESPLHCDVLLVPHHGSKSSKPVQLAAWSTPTWAVFSADHRYDTSSVEAVYARRGHVLHTADTGAVTAFIDEKGLRVETFAAR